MKKLLNTVLMVIVILSMALAACSPAATPTTEPSSEQPVAAEPTAAPAEPSGAALRIWADDTRSKILSELAADFQAKYGVELVVEELAGIRDQFLIAAPAGEAADIIILPHDQIGTLVASGLLAEMDLGDKAAQFVPVSLEAFTIDGKLYGMPYATENMGFFYNTSMVTTPPTTWEEVISMGKALQDEGKAEYGFILSGTTYDAFPLMTSFGAYIFGQDDKGNWNPKDVGVDSEGMIKSVEFIRANVEAGIISDNTDWDTAHSLFETGKVPFIMAGPWALDRFRTAGVPYAITNFPSEGRPFAGVQGFVVNALSENALLAQAFLTEFVATPEVMEKLYVAGNRPSAFVPVLEATSDADLVALGEAGANASLMPAIPEMGSVWAAWADGVSIAIQGQQPAADSMKNAGTQIRDLIAGALKGTVNLPGSYQAAAGCGGDWDPACADTTMQKGDDGKYRLTVTIPAGSYEFKVALDGSWAVNYGNDGKQDGPNYALVLDADGEVTFIFDPETKLVEIQK